VPCRGRCVGTWCVVGAENMSGEKPI
jgi:hypothetical protein